MVGSQKFRKSEILLDTGVSEWTPGGVLTTFEIRSGAGVGFSKEGPEWSRSQFFNKRLVCLLLINIIADCFLLSIL